jgi:hypothetical protein
LVKNFLFIKIVSKRSYGGLCASTVECLSVYGLICLSSCTCSSTQYWNTASYQCGIFIISFFSFTNRIKNFNQFSVNKLTYSQSCGLTSQCIDGAGGSSLVCLSGTCTCSSLYYWTGSVCTAINSYNGGSCTSNNQCDSTKNLTCVTSTCTCGNNLYWDGIVCQTRKLPTLACTYSYECVNNTICSYKYSSSSSTTCNCYNAYYYDYTTQTCSNSIN